MLNRTHAPLLLIGLLIACGDDAGVTTPTIQEPPQTPVPELTFSGTGSTDPAALPVDECVTSMMAESGQMLEYFEDIAAAMTGGPEYVDDIWIWVYDEGVYTHTITCQFVQNGWYWTYSIDGGGLSNWIAADGFTTIDVEYGWWKFYQWGTDSVAFSAEWTGDSSDGTVWWYAGDFSVEPKILLLQLDWSISESSQTATLTVPDGSKTTLTEYADGSGEISVYAWNGDDAWELTFEAHWTGQASGWYTNHITGNTVSWG